MRLPAGMQDQESFRGTERAGRPLMQKLRKQAIARTGRPVTVRLPKQGQSE